MSKEVNILGMSFEDAKKAILDGETIIVPPVRNLPHSKFSVHVVKSREKTGTEFMIDMNRVSENDFWDTLKNEIDEE